MSYSDTLRRVMFPYAMMKNADGSWTFINRSYKPVGTGKTAFNAQNFEFKDFGVHLPKLTAAIRAKLDIRGNGGSEGTIHFYHDGCVPDHSKANMDAYLERLALLMPLMAESVVEDHTDDLLDGMVLNLHG